MVNTKSKEGLTPLMVAVYRNFSFLYIYTRNAGRPTERNSYEDIVELLLEFGADVNDKFEDKSVLDIAAWEHVSDGVKNILTRMQLLMRRFNKRLKKKIVTEPTTKGVCKSWRA